MTNEEIIELLKKLRYQVSILGETIDYKDYPIQSLIMEKDWGETDIDKAHDIFEKWDGILENGGSMKNNEFERDFSESLGIGYQGLKTIILAFYRNGQWSNVCESYVDSFGPSVSIEYHSIKRRER